MSKKQSVIFITLFFLMLAIPLAGLFVQRETVSVDENRTLAKPAVLLDAKGRVNPDFFPDFDAWVSDHIGLRTALVRQSGCFHYAVFRKFPLGNPNVLGPNGELNYVLPETLRDFQHKNRYPEDYRKEVARALSQMAQFAAQQGARFYYYQCWDKPSIYPEYFPKEVRQTAPASRTEELLETISEEGCAVVISPKEALTKGKAQYDTYSVFGDPTHWSPRGAYVGYQVLMEALNRDAPAPFRVLQEADYHITRTDQGLTLYGAIHRPDFLERFAVKAPRAKLTRERLTFAAEDPRSLFYTNEAAGNNVRLLIIGDSYFHSYILDDIAESFSETVFLWGHHLKDYQEAMEAYQPDLVVIENAEREDRTDQILACMRS